MTETRTLAEMYENSDRLLREWEAASERTRIAETKYQEVKRYTARRRVEIGDQFRRERAVIIYSAAVASLVFAFFIFFYGFG
jgi:hypothetical protein